MPRKPDRDIRNYPHMVRWFRPQTLFSEIKGVILSAWFGRYADQRFIQGALDPASEKELVERADLTCDVEVDEDGAVWIDFVADIGDGFDSTYAVASLLAQPHLDVEDSPPLPRGSALIVGGDLVYPSASRDNYWVRMRQPYMLAHPDDQRDGAFHPHFFAIPGNHDWYDGLVSFYDTFCRFLERAPFHGGLKIGNWRCRQQRSYFAVKLPHNWWIWGVDIQLSGHIDQPQVNYFRSIAQSLDDGARIIICTAQPSWLTANQYGTAEYDSINYIARIAQGTKDDTGAAERDVKAIISGDLHHYSRYEAQNKGLHLVTAGGGGAFTHTTHHLGDTIEVPDIYKDIKSDAAPERTYRLGGSGREEACYPHREQSRALLWQNLLFAAKNWEFSLGLGCIYWILSWFFASHDNGLLFRLWAGELARDDTRFSRLASAAVTTIATSPVLAILVIGTSLALVYYADTRKPLLQWSIGLSHAFVHIGLFLGLAFLLRGINEVLFGLNDRDFLVKLLFAAQMIVCGGIAAGIAFTLYLLITSIGFKIHSNEASSALQLADYRNFLRMRLGEDSLTLYPIGLEHVPRRHEWCENPNSREGHPDPIFVPRTPLQPFLIETPVVIEAPQVRKPASKKPGVKKG